MANKLKEWLRNPSIRYMVLSMAASGVNMLTLILYGRVFEVETYGVVSALNCTKGLNMSSLLSGGIWGPSFRTVTDT